MWLEKVRNGFVQVLNESGLHYVRPSQFERFRLLWIFRNFSILPQQVLSLRQQRFVSDLCSEERMFQYWGPNERERSMLIGTLLSSCLPPSTQDRRTFQRAPVEFEVRYGLGRDLTAGHGYDFSAGGLALIGPKSYPPGSEIEVRYRLPSEVNWTAVRVLVRHRNGQRMGVAFLNSGARQLTQPPV
jgi:hypothetical protein